MNDKIGIFIPARMESKRLPGKPLADINGRSMIMHVVDRAHETGYENIYVACSEEEVAQNVRAHDAEAILTDPDHPSGTDRIYEAMLKTGKEFNYVVNLQGDLPLLDHKIIKIAIDTMEKYSDADIITFAAVIKDDDEIVDPNVVKVIASPVTENVSRALYFTRATAPYGEGDLLHHIGLYVYRKEALEKFVKLKQSYLEKRERLEQLRALENAMSIYVVTVDSIPIGVDTEEDLQKVRNIFNTRK